MTVGNPSVAEKEFYGDSIEEALGYLASIERESDHPLAKAVLEEIGDTTFYPVENTEVVKGEGIVANVNGHRVVVGNVALMEKEKVRLDEKAKADMDRLENGNSLVLTAVDGELKILMGVRDRIRPGVKEDLQKLKRLGVKNLIMLSGDNQGTVDVVSRELGLAKLMGTCCPKTRQTTLRNF